MARVPFDLDLAVFVKIIIQKLDHYFSVNFCSCPQSQLLFVVDDLIVLLHNLSQLLLVNCMSFQSLSMTVSDFVL